jgi:uroporphyrin-3 C-methyltransferase
MNDEVISGDDGNADARATIPAAEQSAVKITRSNTVLVAVFGGFAVASLATSAYLYYRTGHTDEYGEHLRTIEAHINELDSKLEALDGDYGEIKTSIKNIGDQQGLLRDSIDSLHRQQKYNDEDWALAEIEHLLIIATQELSLDADVNTALAAMQAADDRLRGMADPLLLNTRSQLLSDITALKSVTAVDITGMALYMADIINRVEQLPLKNSERSAAQQDTGGGLSEEPEKQPLWKRLLRTVWHELKNLVVISRGKDTGIPPPMPEQRYYLHQSLRMELDAARLAIVQRDSDNLRASLELVQQWLEKYFDVHDAAISNIMVSLRQMSGVTLRPEMPDISSSLETLRAVIRERTASEPADPQPVEE